MNGEGEGKKLDGQFVKDMDEKASENSWLIMAKERISEEREGRVPAQSQALGVNAIKDNIV